jgi:phospholipase/carboxylesterase
MTQALSFTHRFEPAGRLDAPPLLLLHGTGGDESDLLPLGRAVAPGSALLSPRGKVLEAGMPRFFRRLREGVFDEEDVRARANELADFVAKARAAYGLAAPVALGFSNGANIAAAMLLLRPEALAGACCCAGWCRSATLRRRRCWTGRYCCCRARSTRSSRPTMRRAWPGCWAQRALP